MNYDLIREYITRSEPVVQRIAYEQADQALAAGRNVVWDNTSLNPAEEIRLRDLAANHGAAFEVKFLDISPSEAIQRDCLRSDPVGAPAIYGMYNRYLRPPV